MSLNIASNFGKNRRKVAIAISGNSAREICRSLVLNSTPQDNYQIELVIVERRSNSDFACRESSSFVVRFIQKMRTRVFQASLFFERYLARKAKILREGSTQPIENLRVPIRVISFSPCGQGQITYSNEDTTLLASFEIDVLVHLNSHQLVTDGTPLAGIEQLSIRGGSFSLIESIESLCFESVHQRQSKVEALVLLDRKGCGEAHLVGKISVPTKWLTTVTLEAFQAKAGHLIHVALNSSAQEEIDSTGFAQTSAVAVPTACSSMLQLLVTAISLGSRMLSSAFGADPQWHVAYSFKSHWATFTVDDLRVIPNPSGRFYADPLLLEHGGRHFCFVEDYDSAARRGRITVLELDEDGHRYLGTALEEEFHLSFPFVFKHGDEIFMCPDSAGSNQVRLYRAEDFPLNWTLDQVLLDDTSAVDTTIFQKGGRWWMLTNVSPEGGPNHQSELHLYSSLNLRTSDWTAHPRNPVVNDARKARNGGLIVEEANIFRASQIYDFDSYGASIEISRVSNISEEVYEEELIRHVVPSGRGLKGLHTVSIANDLLATDLLFRSRKEKLSVVWSQEQSAQI